MKENGTERRAVENAYNWLKKHDPEYLEKMNLPYGYIFMNLSFNHSIC